MNRPILIALLSASLPATLLAQAPEPGAEAPAAADAAAVDAEAVDDLEILPVLKELVVADYPPRALEEGVTAEVLLAIDIDAEGHVEAVSVIEQAQPAGYDFDAAAVAAALRFEFEPAIADGQPVPVQIAYRYSFTLEERVVPPAPEAPAPEPVANFVGQLLERGTRKPLAGAVVTVFRPQVEGEQPVGFEAVADSDGRFALYDLAAGTWNILVQPEGYFPFRTNEELTSTDKVEATYYVERGSYNPFDVMVTASRPRKELSRTTLKTQEIEKVPGAMGDPVSVVKNVPGVARSGFGDGRLAVRGASPSDTGVLVAGVPVPTIYHFGNLRSIIPAGMLESVDFYPGNFSVEYGRATAGVLDVQLKRDMPEAMSGYLDVSLMDTGIFVEAPIGSKASVALAGRRSYMDVVLNAAMPDDADVDFVTAPRYYDYQLLANFRPTPAHELRAFAFASDDRMELLFANPAAVDTSYEGGDVGFSVKSRQLMLEHRYVPSRTFEHRLRVSVASFSEVQDIGSQLYVHSNGVGAVLREDVSWRFNEQLTFESGLDLLAVETTWDVKAPPPTKEGDLTMGTPDFNNTKSVDAKLASYEPAAYAKLEWQPIEGLAITPGLRVDYNSTIDEVMASPRFGVRYEINDTWLAKAGVGLFHQSPDGEETSEEFGNPKLRAEKALHYTAGVEAKPLEHLTIDAQVFYKQLSSMTSRTGDTTVRNGETVPKVYDSKGEGRVYGAELMVRHAFANNFFGWLSYTVSRSERLDSGATDYRIFDMDQTHILTLLGTYKLPMNWEIGARWRLVSGNPATPIVGSVYNADRDTYEPIPGRTNSARDEAFHQLDLRVDKRWIYDGWILSMYLDVQNVYSRSNAEGVAYNYDYAQSETAAGLPLLTILGIRGEF